MNIKHVNTLVALLAVFAVNAQPTIAVPKVQTDAGKTITVPVRLMDFQDILSLQFTLNWDSTVLRLNTVQDFGLKDFDQNDINTAPGRIMVLWIDPAVSGIPVADSTVVINLLFEVIGADGMATPLSFGSDPVTQEVGSSTGEIKPEWKDGQVTVGEVTTQIERLTSVEGVQVFPNPVSTSAIVKWQQAQRQFLQLQLLDAAGRQVWTRADWFEPGNQQLIFHAQDFPSSGWYVLKVMDTRGGQLAVPVLKQ